MLQRKQFISKWNIFAFICMTLSIPTLSAHKGEPLTPDELMAKYGQVNLTASDPRNCNRPCEDGIVKTCYYRFNLQMYDTMGGLCGNCGSGVITDCFLPGCIPGNGVPRSILTINQTIPGPQILVCENDRVIIDLTNHVAGTEASIHWHGVHQRETPWHDGVPMVTQCPISGGDTYRYQYSASPVGTLFYHGHSGFTRTNGIFGGLTIREANDPNRALYDFDLPEHEIRMTDWNNQTAEIYNPGIRNQNVEADSILINGMGSYYNPATGRATFAPMATFYCQRGKRYRFRIGNFGSHHCPMTFNIANHSQTVISTDGFSIEPVVVGSVGLGVGERYDVVITATTNRNIARSLITVQMSDICAALQIQEFAQIIFVDDITTYQRQLTDYTPLAVRPAYSSLVTGIFLNNPHTNCSNPSGNICLPSLVQKGVGSTVAGNLRNVPVAASYNFTFGFSGFVNRPPTYESIASLAFVGLINNIASGPSEMPGLIQDDSKVPYCNSTSLPAGCTNTSACLCTHLVQLPYCKPVSFTFINPGAFNGTLHHPIHLHGFGFQVLDIGTIAQLQSGQTPYRNATHLPVIKDTVTVPSGSFVILKFNSCNAGYWFMHCHFEFHMHIGMNVIIKVGTHKDMLKPPHDIPKCGNFFDRIYDYKDYWYGTSDD